MHDVDADFFKAHAYGNDFLFVPAAQVTARERASLARHMCDRHTGIGADGLAFYTPTPNGAAMTLLNADGSRSEVSGNGVRCLAAIRVDTDADLGTRARRGEPVVIGTDAGDKALTLLEAAGDRFTFDAAMGQPEGVRQVDLDVEGEHVRAVVLRVGNPQCVILGTVPDEARCRQLGAALSRHPAFAAGTNVELAEVESPSRVRIFIWERGVGPTLASGTGACAAAVAAATYGGAEREVEVVAPGGTQRVVWTEEGLRLTGWADVICAGRWHGGRANHR